MQNLPGIGNFSSVLCLARSIRKIFVWELLGPHTRAWGSLVLSLTQIKRHSHILSYYSVTSGNEFFHYRTHTESMYIEIQTFFHCRLVVLPPDLVKSSTVRYRSKTFRSITNHVGGPGSPRQIHMSNVKEVRHF